jgi:hypothetical protein
VCSATEYRCQKFCLIIMWEKHVTLFVECRSKTKYANTLNLYSQPSASPGNGEFVMPDLMTMWEVWC